MAEDTDSSADVNALRGEIVRLRAENEKLKASNHRWMRIAGTDDLTGLPNKVFFTTALLPQHISKSDAEAKFVGMLMAAPDNLGEINQRHGRKGGDRIVKEVAEFLKANVDSGERLVHIDGANFAILLPDADLQRVRRKGQELRARIYTRTFPCNGDSVSLTLSIGVVARAPTPEGSRVDLKKVTDEFLKRLGTVLDRAKQQGGDRVDGDEVIHF